MSKLFNPKLFNKTCTNTNYPLTSLKKISLNTFKSANKENYEAKYKKLLAEQNADQENKKKLIKYGLVATTGITVFGLGCVVGPIVFVYSILKRGF